MTKDVVVTIHGVGDAIPGASLSALASASGGRNAYSRADLVLGSITYPRLLGDDNSGPDLLEVNWSDIQRPQRSVLGALLHVLKLGVGIPSISFDWNSSSGSFGHARAIYQQLVQTTFLWITFPVLLVLIHYTVADNSL
ncbi:MAG: hypothetical protein RLO18_03755, partial [Gimesia chilikensis]